MGPATQDVDAVTGTYSTEIVDRSGGLRFPMRIELDQLFGR
jgi:hypothetical protein